MRLGLLVLPGQRREMPDEVVILTDGAVRGENTALSDVDDLLARPRLLVEVIRAQTALRLLIRAEVLEHQIRVGHAARCH